MPKYEHRAGQPDKTIAKGSSTSPDIFEGWTLRFAEMPPRERGLQIKWMHTSVLVFTWTNTRGLQVPRGAIRLKRQFETQHKHALRAHTTPFKNTQKKMLA